MNRTTGKSEIRVKQRVREYFVTRKALGGFIKWDELVKTDQLGNEVYLHTASPPSTVYLNGIPIFEAERISSRDKLTKERGASKRATPEHT
jgi:hypothetical protein